MSRAEIEAEIARLEEGGYYTVEQLEEDKTWYPRYAYVDLYRALRQANQRKKRVMELKRELQAMDWQEEYDRKANEWFEQLSTLKVDLAEAEAVKPFEMDEFEYALYVAALKAEIQFMEANPYHLFS